MLETSPEMRHRRSPRGSVALLIIVATSHVAAQDTVIARPIAPIAPRYVAPPPITGFADLHGHQHSNVAFGGLLVWGQPFGPREQALASDVPAHGIGGIADPIGHVVRLRNKHPNVPLIGHPVGGHPRYDGWPTYDNVYTHTAWYQDWLKRAVDGGLRLLVMYAVNAEALCEASKLLGKIAPGRTCGDMEAVDRQIAQARMMEQYIDNQHGGAGKGWYRIVHSPQEARGAIAKGQLAVVLGIEVQSIFDCQPGRKCNEVEVRRHLDRYHAMGVRQIVPIHNTNNLFGGAALFRDQYNVNNRKLTGQWFKVGPCKGGVELRLSALTFEEQREIATIWPELAEALPAYPPGFHCNAEGLTPLGRQMIQGMMHRKMIVDFDHLSQRSFADALALTQQLGGYPLVSSHTGLVSTAKGSKRTEFWKTDEQVEQIRASGGLMALLLAQGRREEAGVSDEAKQKRIANDCGNSSKTWAHVYLRAVSLMRGDAVALATDFGGFVPGLAPRFGTNECDGQRGGPQLNAIKYPFVAHGTGVQLGRAVTGERTFDYNTDGLAHVGMLPDFIQDLKQIGLTDADLAPLFRSAEAYIRLWERIERTNVADF